MQQLVRDEAKERVGPSRGSDKSHAVSLRIQMSLNPPDQPLHALPHRVPRTVADTPLRDVQCPRVGNRVGRARRELCAAGPALRHGRHLWPRQKRTNICVVT